ncbi:DgyrCDS10906 [Dimorphilus gyrociliatus]|uniref:DgyrCDS10906 n=1 Tax=Dimorphilus gyrociliatus TaxID=2664684 RepID=A0A7I8W1P8_9ANNE|nr:DgyrCDS10906 [Dimorphilus gyrociliatus]
MTDQSNNTDTYLSANHEKATSVQERIVFFSKIDENQTANAEKSATKVETSAKELQNRQIVENVEIEKIKESKETNNHHLVIEGAQLFYIAPTGVVSAPSYPSQLTISPIAIDANNENSLPAVELKLGSWSYALVPDISPVFKSDYGSFIFPNEEMGLEHSVGVILPQTTSEYDKQSFENIIQEYSMLKISGEYGRDEEKTKSEIVTLLTAAGWIATGVFNGVSKLGGAGLRDRLTPSAEEVNVKPEVQNSLQIVRQCSEVAANISSSVVNYLSGAVIKGATFAGPHLRKGTEKVLPDSWTKVKDTKNRSRLDNAILIGSGGFKGMFKVFVSLENAAAVLAKSLAEESIKTMRHKYGEQSGMATENVLCSAMNIGMVGEMVEN